MSRQRTHGVLLAGLAGFSLIAAACGSSASKTSSPATTPSAQTAGSTASTVASTATTTGSAATTTGSAATTAAAAASSTPVATTIAGPAKVLAKSPGFDGTTIQVGAITALSGSAAVIGTQLAAGQDVYWKYYNKEKGGIAGKYPVKLLLEDSLYETTTTVQKYNKIKNDIVMLTQVMGTAPTLALLPLLKADNLVASPASQDDIWVREQQLFPILEPYQIDAINAMDYEMNEGGGKGKKVCVVLQNDVYGEAGLKGVQFAGDKMGFKITASPRFKLGDQDFTAQVNELKNAGCEIVFAVALPIEFGKMLGGAAALGFTPQWIGQSPAWVDALLATPLKDYMTKHVLIAAVGPTWGDPAVPAAVDYVNRVKTYKPDQTPNYYFTFGYFQAQAESQLLEKAVALGSLDRAGIVAAMNSLDTLKFDGLAGDYAYGTPEQRNPTRVSSVFKVNPDAPFGLEAVKYNFSSDAAKAYVFPATNG